MGNEYRITRDHWGYHYAQCRRWWFPVWLTLPGSGFYEAGTAELQARQHADPTVKLLGKLP